MIENGQQEMGREREKDIDGCLVREKGRNRDITSKNREQTKGENMKYR